jgi:hypothetical protein
MEAIGPILVLASIPLHRRCRLADDQPMGAGAESAALNQPPSYFTSPEAQLSTTVIGSASASEPAR